MHSVHDILSARAGPAPAIGGLDRAPLSYQGLQQLAATVGTNLHSRGIGRGDRVAIVLPNGPEMAAAFLAVAASASTAPLNPAYTRDEFTFYLADLRPKAVLLMRGVETPARDAAEFLGIPVLELIAPANGPAGSFHFEGDYPRDAVTSTDGPAQPDDEALVLHTSGTTSRPKVVPLTNANLAASAAHIRETLTLTEADIGLNIMPLFHIHGLIASLLSSISAGAQVVCTPGFNALKIFAWFAEVKPTWYTAVPTMHQAIVSRAPRNAETVEALSLRFVRSSSSSLPPPVMADLEATFRATVVEAYGMTEAAHQMASNPISAGTQKPGTVGTAAGPEVAIMSETGVLLGTGDTGEIVIRGPNVFSGYENNPDANADSFADGWFRTGDLGVLDGDGYLSVTGRLKEIINRGGEKIAPREVEEVLQTHPAVDQVVTFAVPHPKLGEDVAAVVVLKEDASVSEADLRAHAAQSLADFKVPRMILFREEIPKGATGKLQRIGLAEKLGLGQTRANV